MQTFRKPPGSSVLPCSSVRICSEGVGPGLPWRCGYESDVKIQRKKDHGKPHQTESSRTVAGHNWLNEGIPIL